MLGQNLRPELKLVETVADRVPFSTFPGRCFRFVDDGRGHFRHCRNPIIGTGTFTDADGHSWTADACEEHAGELTGLEPPG